MTFTNRTVPWDKASHSRELLLSREWLVTNGLGGFASGTISGAITRRYHGLLIAALPAPHGRMVMWSHVSEFLRFADEDVISLGAEERAGGQLNLGAADYLHEFRLENGLPVWAYHVRDLVVEKRILMLHLQNDVHVIYRILEGEKRMVLSRASRRRDPARPFVPGDQVSITPAGRADAAPRDHAQADEKQTVSTGFRCFTGRGRHNVISLDEHAMLPARCLEDGY